MVTRQGFHYSSSSISFLKSLTDKVNIFDPSNTISIFFLEHIQWYQLTDTLQRTYQKICKPNQTDLEMICFDFLKINSKLFKINRHKPAANEVISTLTDSLVKSVEELTSWTKQLHAFLSDQVVKVSHPKKFAKKN